MPSIETLIQERKEKRQQLISADVSPYPATANRTHSIHAVDNRFEELTQEETDIWVAGRILAIREHGGVVFFDIFDGTGELQIVLKKDNLDEQEYELFIDAVDVGDFVEVYGHTGTTQTGQESVIARKWRMLAKAVRPIPSQWSGLEDKEKRLRKRYLDILMNDEVRDMVEKRSKFWKTIREFLEQRDFLEVQTPVLEKTPGGADARPFRSHHNALDIEVFLRISAGELWQKKLLVGGFERVFEVGRIFRNEGQSFEHAQDYMQMEFYWAYADHTDGMELVKQLYRHITKNVFGKTKFDIRGHTVDFGDEWTRYDYTETIKEIAGVDITQASGEQIRNALSEHDVEFDENVTKPKAIDKLWKYCRKQISGPGFLINVPAELSPLAKRKSDNPDVVAQFQPLIAGSELGKGYNELNDPREQADRFRGQEALRDAGDQEAQRFDEDFIEALQYGMPPACGFGVSERLFAFLVDKPIKESQIFPLLRSQDSNS